MTATRCACARATHAPCNRAQLVALDARRKTSIRRSLGRPTPNPKYRKIGSGFGGLSFLSRPDTATRASADRTSARHPPASTHGWLLEDAVVAARGLRVGTGLVLGAAH